MVSTPGNYDYINSYIFRYDGSIEIDIKMGGYMSTSYWDPSEWQPAWWQEGALAVWAGGAASDA